MYLVLVSQEYTLRKYWNNVVERYQISGYYIVLLRCRLDNIILIDTHSDHPSTVLEIVLEVVVLYVAGTPTTRYVHNLRAPVNSLRTARYVHNLRALPTTFILCNVLYAHQIEYAME